MCPLRCSIAQLKKTFHRSSLCWVTPVVNYCYADFYFSIYKYYTNEDQFWLADWHHERLDDCWWSCEDILLWHLFFSLLQQMHILSHFVGCLVLTMCILFCHWIKQVLPKSFGESRIATPYGREWTHPLCVLLAVHCPLQMSAVTQPPVRYIHTAVPHSSYASGIHCVV